MFLRQRVYWAFYIIRVRFSVSDMQSLFSHHKTKNLENNFRREEEQKKSIICLRVIWANDCHHFSWIKGGAVILVYMGWLRSFYLFLFKKLRDRRTIYIYIWRGKFRKLKREPVVIPLRHFGSVSCSTPIKKAISDNDIREKMLLNFMGIRRCTSKALCCVSFRTRSERISYRHLRSEWF